MVTLILFLEEKLLNLKMYLQQEKDDGNDDTPFLKHFDENGNFIESIEPKTKQEQPIINYTFKENKD